MSQQTAVEWFNQQLINRQNGNGDSSWDEIYEQAKQMENEQSFVHFKAGQDSMEEEGKSFDQYYNETFKK